jgi:hypothetical protein
MLRNGASEIGEGGGLHADQFGQVFAARTFQRQRRRRVGGDPYRRRRGRRIRRDLLGPHGALALAAQWIAARRPPDALGIGGETVLELRGREALFEAVAAGGMGVGGQGCCGRRLAALDQEERERRKDCKKGDRAPARRHAERHRYDSAIMRR